jgi:hypothetical protein
VGAFSLREREQEREGEEEFLWFEKENGWQQDYLFASWDPPARGTRGQSARCEDAPAPRRRRSVTRSRISSTAPLPLEPRGQSASPWWTVRQERTDSPALSRGPSGLPFLFQLDIFRDKDLKKYLLGPLLKNNEGNLSYDAMYQLMLGNYAKASFTKIREQKQEIS